MTIEAVRLSKRLNGWVVYIEAGDDNFAYVCEDTTLDETMIRQVDAAVPRE